METGGLSLLSREQPKVFSLMRDDCEFGVGAAPANAELFEEASAHDVDSDQLLTRNYEISWR